jgi:hypothetical protein
VRQSFDTFLSLLCRLLIFLEFIQTQNFIRKSVFVFVSLNSFIVMLHCSFVIVDSHKLITFCFTLDGGLPFLYLLQTPIYFSFDILSEIELQDLVEYIFSNIKLSFPGTTNGLSCLDFCENETRMHLLLLIA